MLTVRMDGRNSSCTVDRIAMTSALPPGTTSESQRGKHDDGQCHVQHSVGLTGSLLTVIICSSLRVAELNIAISATVMRISTSR